ncbi:hypothetical protein PTI98_013351 [Pleurotus ostreatus]|nr:hypothetical protein PTI98_013351 [Pleurotus ostreatus]
MFSIRIAAVVLAASALLAAASPIANTETPVNQCGSGSIQCCESVQSAVSLSTSYLVPYCPSY